MICHGVEDTLNPRQSHLQLWKQPNEHDLGSIDPLYVSDIGTWALSNTAVVFVAACWAASSGSFQFSDEHTSILGAFASAGVPDVIGSMWPVSSTVASFVADKFWLGFSAHKNCSCSAAVMLHCAILVCAISRPEHLLDWGGFIHVGGHGSLSSDECGACMNSEPEFFTCDGCEEVCITCIRSLRQQSPDASRLSKPFKLGINVWIARILIFVADVILKLKRLILVIGLQSSEVFLTRRRPNPSDLRMNQPRLSRQFQHSTEERLYGCRT